MLGGVGATLANGSALDVGPAKCQALLAALALAPGVAVPVWRLVEAVWGELPPRTAERTLQSYVTRLRKALGPKAIVRAGLAYRLDLPAGAIDAARFERALDAGAIDVALTEWTGAPLAGIDAPGLRATADALVERWLGAVETDLERRVERDPAATIGALTELTARNPYREALWVLLMTALYRVGRQADALAAYRTARARLSEELGIEPGPRLRELETLVLGQDPALAAPAPGPEWRPAGNLPRRARRLIGREQDLRRVLEALADDALVTLVGPGGVGKTTLAIAAAQHARVAARASGGSWLVELADLSAAGDVARATAEAIGASEQCGRTPTEAVVAALDARPGLLVLDNCEHVVEGAAALAAAVVAGCPLVRVLATSREPLGHSEERLVSLTPLALSSALELFAERAGAHAAADRPSVEAICRRLDGLPLALELAAARTRALAPADLLDRLDTALGARRTGPERQRTMEATIQWSYDLLTQPERDLFARLSVFAGPFPLAAAEAAAGADGALLGDLVDRSLVTVEPDRRLRLLEPLRAFAARRLNPRAPHAGRHARWCRDEVVAIGRALAGPDELAGAQALDALWPNLRAAFGWACETGDGTLAIALVRPVVAEIMRRSRHELGDWAERILALGGPQERVFGLAWAGHRYAITQHAAGYDALVARHGEPDHALVRHARAFAHDDYPTLITTAPAAAAEHRRRGEADLAEHADVDLGVALLNVGRLSEHDAHVGALAERYRAHGPPTLHNWALMLLGYSAAFQGDRRTADARFAQAVAITVPPRTHSPNRPIEARVAFRRGDRARARRILLAHVDELLATGNLQGGQIAAIEVVNLATAEGRRADAARLLGYLETTGLLGAGFGVLVNTGAPDPKGALDDRTALEVMRAVLTQVPGRSRVDASMPTRPRG